MGVANSCGAPLVGVANSTEMIRFDLHQLLRFGFASASAPQWTSEPYESVDATHSTVREAAEPGDRGCSQSLDRTQDPESGSASGAAEASDHRTDSDK